jgi:hypothetical protein
MSTYELITLITPIVSMVGLSLGSYIKMNNKTIAIQNEFRTEIEKIKTELTGMNRESRVREIAILLQEKNNREDHKELMLKFDLILKIKS